MKQKVHWPFENALKNYFITSILNTKFHTAVNGEDWQKRSREARSQGLWLDGSTLRKSLCSRTDETSKLKIKISYFPTKFQGKILATSKTKAKVISILLLVLITKDDYSQCLALHNVPQISV